MGSTRVVSRRSHESLFLQPSDLVACAAFRRVFPPPGRSVQIVPELMWDELGASTLAKVNQRRPLHIAQTTTMPSNYFAYNFVRIRT